MDKRHFIISLALSLILFIYGCATNYAANTPFIVDPAIKNKTYKLNEAIMLSASPKTALMEDYQIGPEDVIEIEAYNVEELKKTVRVNSNGEIALPLVGIIKAEGMTTPELEKVITERLERYVEETVVTVFVKEYRSHRISVLGAVKNPQLYAVTGQRHLIDMLMMAGGLNEEAGNKCYVIRPAMQNSPESRAGTIVIDLNELLINGNFALNIPVFAGDVINVPRGGTVFVEGAVKKPGVFNMHGKTTLVQAIAMAQGLDSGAQLNDIRIFRDNDKGERDVIAADYEAIMRGENPDILIVENDIIVVPKGGVKNFFSGFISAIKGLIYFTPIPLF
ncbi:MAG: polysaccharide biosynthesis/export family protein [Nitrospirota bacterium]